MGNVGTGIRYKTMLAAAKAAQAKDFIDKEADKKRREEQAQKELAAMQPVLKLFKLGYKDVLGEGSVENIIGLYNKPIARFSLIVRLGGELEKRGLSRKTWETIASKAFL